MLYNNIIQLFLLHNTLFVLNNMFIFSFINHIIPDKPMSDKSYTAATTSSYKAIGIRTTVQLHINRIQIESTLDVEEVDGLDKRSLGNWVTNIFCGCYITKLPLPAIY